MLGDGIGPLHPGLGDNYSPPGSASMSAETHSAAYPGPHRACRECPSAVARARTNEIPLIGQCIESSQEKFAHDRSSAGGPSTWRTVLQPALCASVEDTHSKCIITIPSCVFFGGRAEW